MPIIVSRLSKKRLLGLVVEDDHAHLNIAVANVVIAMGLIGAKSKTVASGKFK